MFGACISRLLQIAQGWLVYLLALLDIPIDYFEQQRFEVRRVNENPTTNDKHTKNETKVLLISFAGATFLVGGFPRAEFQTVLEKAAVRCGVTADCLFLVDPSVTFYIKSSSARRKQTSSSWEGWDEVVEYIRELVARQHYDKVICVGSSMGATAILSLVGRFPCDTAIVFNPLVDLVNESRWRFYVGGLRLPSSIRCHLPDIMAEQCLQSKANVIVHFSTQSPTDIVQLGYLQQAIQRRQTPEDSKMVFETIGHDTDKHVLPRELKKTDQLLPLLESALRQTLLRQNTQEQKRNQLQL